MTLSEELAWRGFTNQTTFKDTKELDNTKRTFYWGVDPSAPSMQIGNLAAAMMAKVFIKHGYKPVLLVGGATGLIGDPDGKAQERDLKTAEEITSNKKAIVKQYEMIFKGLDFEVVDNLDWFKSIGYLEFLRVIGKHVPMRQMLSRDFVQSRLGEDGAGISYAEFSYSLIQGYDFLHLFENNDVTLQLSGADQWGNSIAGVDLIRRKTGKEAHVWTTPLVVNKATGVKFGKTEDGAVWLDAKQTSPYKFFQFWLNADDEGVEDYLKIFTELDKTDIESVIDDFNSDKAQRAAQKKLAYEVTKLVHGKEVADSVVNITKVLFGENDYTSLSADDFVQLKAELPLSEAKIGDNIVSAVVEAGLADSNSQARRFAEQGAIYVNGKSITPEHTFATNDLIDGSHAILRRGKNSNAIVQIKN